MAIVKSTSTQAAYKSYYDLLDRALDSKAGIRMRFGNIGQAKHLRVRLNYARTMDRERSQLAYPPSDPNHGTSAYDLLVIRVEGDEDEGVLTIEHVQIPTNIEEIVA